MAERQLVEIARTPALNNESFLAREWTVLVEEFEVGDFMFSKLARVTTCQCDVTYKSFKTHSLIEFTSSWPQFEMMASRTFGWTDLNT